MLGRMPAQRLTVTAKRQSSDIFRIFTKFRPHYEFFYSISSLLSSSAHLKFCIFANMITFFTLYQQMAVYILSLTKHAECCLCITRRFELL
ncbi:hypothetical protein X975_01583, partial [Stegodyphus mimosarum]